MLDIKYIRNNIEEVISKLAVKGFAFDRAVFEQLDAARKQADISAQDLQAQRKQASKKIGGLIASGKSVEEAQGRYEKLSEEANKMFDELVSKGETLEEDARSKFKSTTNDVENRVADVRKKLGLDSEPADQRIEELSAKIDALTEAVAKLAASK